MRIVFLGTSDFAVPVLDALHGSGHPLALVVTAPDRKSGRGQKLERCPVAARCAELGLAPFQPVRVNAPESLELLARAEPDLMVVVAYGQILSDRLLAIAKRGSVNLHGSLLPRLRGAAPIARAIQAGETTTGVTLQFMAREVDSGDVIGSRVTDIGDDETAGALSQRMSALAAGLLVEFLPALARGDAPRSPQRAADATFAPKLAKGEGRIAWDRPAETIRRHVRAMTPWPSAFSEVETDRGVERLIVRACTAKPDAKSDAPPGTVLRSDDALEIAAGSGAVALDSLLRAGRKEQDARSFLRGFPLPAGSRLR